MVIFALEIVKLDFINGMLTHKTLSCLSGRNNSLPFEKMSDRAVGEIGHRMVTKPCFN